MPSVIQLSDHKVETLFDKRDFEYLIDRYMGYDAVNYFRELLSEYEESIEEQKAEMDDMSRTITNLIEQIKELGGRVETDD